MRITWPAACALLFDDYRCRDECRVDCAHSHGNLARLARDRLIVAFGSCTQLNLVVRSFRIGLEWASEVGLLRQSFSHRLAASCDVLTPAFDGCGPNRLWQSFTGRFCHENASQTLSPINYRWPLSLAIVIGATLFVVNRARIGEAATVNDPVCRNHLFSVVRNGPRCQEKTPGKISPVPFRRVG